VAPSLPRWYARLSVLEIETAEVFEPLLEPARDKAAWGGRGSGKSQFFGGLACEDAVRFPGDHGVGLRMVCIREVQKSLAQSAKALIEKKLVEHGLGEAQGFKVFRDQIELPGDGVIIFQGMQDHTAESIKSLEGYHRAWIEEAQTLSATSLKLLRPTIREEDSELWWSWNPRRKIDPVDVLFRQGNTPTGAVVVKANWSDNPWFPKVLENERLDCLNNDPDQYDHIWEGGYVSVAEGAYYAKQLAKAKAEGRIGKVSADPLLPIKLFADIGGTGAKSDAFVFWAAQFVGQEIRVLDHYEAQGQEARMHVNWARSKGYGPEDAEIVLPHDGETGDRVYAVSYESFFKQAGYRVTVIPNQGRGAAGARIEEARRLFPQMWFNESTTTAGLEALGWYHEKKDENRNIGLGPEHDWSSHSADAFGLMCVAHKPPTMQREEIDFVGWG
jgi:phage terminase large subunit